MALTSDDNGGCGVVRPSSVSAEINPADPNSGCGPATGPPGRANAPSGKRIAPLDGLRGCAVLMVLLYHFGFGYSSGFAPLHALGWAMKQGWLGVTVFFVLSGFLITGILWDSRETPGHLKRFYVRRVCRIFPLYYLAILLTVIAACFTGTFALSLSRSWTTALFLQDFPGYPRFCVNSSASPLILSHFWSLAVEEHFYLIWPFLLALCVTKRSALRTCLFLLVALELTAVACALWPKGYNFLPLFITRGGEMAAGACLAFLYRSATFERLKRPAQAIFFISVAAYIAMDNIKPVGAALGIFWQPIITLMGASLLVMSLLSGWVSRIMMWRWLRWVGGISYGIYVYNSLFGEPFRALAQLILHQNAGFRVELLLRIIAVGGTFGISWLSFRYFESPIIRWGHAYRSAPKRRVAEEPNTLAIGS